MDCAVSTASYDMQIRDGSLSRHYALCELAETLDINTLLSYYLFRKVFTSQFHFC